MVRQRLSLKARALMWLAQREQSRSELRRKLLRVARAELKAREAAKAAQGGMAGGMASDAGGDPFATDPHAPVPSAAAARDVLGAPSAPDPISGGCADPERCVDALLDWLQAHRYLSEARFVESRIHARVSRYGNLRIRQELAQHGVSPDDAAIQQLRDTELERARNVWQRKFGVAEVDDPAARAKHMRFLAQRGFSADVVRRVVKSPDDDGP